MRINDKVNNEMTIAEIIQASTPIVLALIGGIVAITVIFKNNEGNSCSGMGIASTAIAGGAGLSQQYKSKN